MLSITVNSSGVMDICYPVKFSLFAHIWRTVRKMIFLIVTVTIYGLDRKVSAHLASLRIVRCGPFEPTSDIVGGTLQYFSMAARDRNL